MGSGGGLERRAIEGHVVETGGYHPMTLAGTCLTCGRSDMSVGCAVKGIGKRIALLMRRGLSESVARDLRYADAQTFAEVEAANDKEIAAMSRLAEERDAASTQPTAALDGVRDDGRGGGL